MKRIGLLFMFITCAGGALAKPAGVVTDIVPVHALVSMVMGNTGAPTLLLTGSDDPHHIQLRPSQARKLSDADAIIWMGPNFEPWLGDSISALSAGIPVLNLAQLVPVLDHDPHSWLDPDNAVLWLGEIATFLAAADRDNADTYHVNANTAAQSIASLDQELLALLAPAREQGFVVSHDAFAYLAAHYGLTILGAISDTEAHEPGAAHVAEIKSLVGSGDVSCVIADVTHPEPLIDLVLGDSGVPMVELDPLGLLTAEGPDRYAAIMRALARGFAECAVD